VIESVLGPGFLRLPDFWVWFVDPKRGEKGWTPHRDKNRSTIREDGSPKSLTVWIPLTESTPLNGCIYMVPADRDPTYNTDRQNEWLFDYQDIRALPAAPGSILAWNQQVLHWGASGSLREINPRISVAVEFQAGDVPPYREPLSMANSVPSFDFRRQLIAKQILQYQHMYPLDPEVRAIAEQMLA
jgi:ectoine hydroxylase-related dioxygenase (phytanoyl-CoA dioxygenase family)